MSIQIVRRLSGVGARACVAGRHLASKVLRAAALLYSGSLGVYRCSQTCTPAPSHSRGRQSRRRRATSRMHRRRPWTVDAGAPVNADLVARSILSTRALAPLFRARTPPLEHQTTSRRAYTSSAVALTSLGSRGRKRIQWPEIAIPVEPSGAA